MIPSILVCFRDDPSRCVGNALISMSIHRLTRNVRVTYQIHDLAGEVQSVKTVHDLLDACVPVPLRNSQCEGHTG